MSGWLLMVLSAGTGAYCLARLRSDSKAARSAAGGEAVMGFGMAAMALPAAVVTPPAWGWAVFVAVFGGGALRALWLSRTSTHHLHHLVGTLAMVYMAITMAPGGAHDGHPQHSPGGLPLLTGVLLVYYALYVLRAGAALIPVPTTASTGGGPATPPRPPGAGAAGWGRGRSWRWPAGSPWA